MFFLRGLSAIVGILIIVATTLMLWDGEAVLGVGSMRMYHSSVDIRIDSLLELALTTIVFGSLATAFLVAGLAPQVYRRTPLLAILSMVTFIGLTVIAMLAPKA